GPWAHGVGVGRAGGPEVKTALLSHDGLGERVAARLGRKVGVVGACTGSDAHTVGIDAVLNYKGYAGDKGLESYRAFEAHNLGAQVENAELAARARSLRADAILVSQVVTQRNCHKENASDLARMIRDQGWRNQVILLLGGPRIDHKLALELGFDAGFGPGTKPSEVANYLCQRLCGEEASLKPPA